MTKTDFQSEFKNSKYLQTLKFTVFSESGKINPADNSKPEELINLKNQSETSIYSLGLGKNQLDSGKYFLNFSEPKIDPISNLDLFESKDLYSVDLLRSNLPFDSSSLADVAFCDAEAAEACTAAPTDHLISEQNNPIGHGMDSTGNLSSTFSEDTFSIINSSPSTYMSSWMDRSFPSFSCAKISNSYWAVTSPTHSPVALGSQCFLSMDDFDYDDQPMPVLLRYSPIPSSKRQRIKLRRPIKVSPSLWLKAQCSSWRSVRPITDINDDDTWHNISDDEQDLSPACNMPSHSAPPHAPTVQRPRNRPGPTIEGLLASFETADRIMCGPGVANVSLLDRLLLAASQGPGTVPPLCPSTTLSNTTPTTMDLLGVIESPPGEGNDVHLSRIALRTNLPTNATTPSTSTHYKNSSLNPMSSPFYLSSTSGPVNKYSKLTGAMGAPLKALPNTDVTAYANPTLFSTAKITTPTTATTSSTVTSAPSLINLTITAIRLASTSSPTIFTTTTSSTLTTPPSTHDKINRLNPEASPFYPSSSEDLGPFLNE